MERTKKHLYRLDELKNYQVASESSDIRNWEVRDADDRLIGKVDSLLVNIPSKRVVYVDVEVDESVIAPGHDPYSSENNQEIREFVNTEGDTHIIIPIGMISIDEEKRQVRASAINHRTFSETPRYNKNSIITRPYEESVLRSYNSASLSDEKKEDFYNRSEFNRSKEN